MESCNIQLTMRTTKHDRVDLFGRPIAGLERLGLSTVTIAWN